MSYIELLRRWGYRVSERPITRRSGKGGRAGLAGRGVRDRHRGSNLPIGELKVDDRNIVINDNKIGEVARRLYDT